MSQHSTRDALLDAAEELIAGKGYASTSLRDITSLAKANLAAINYHFGSKNGLAKALLERRLAPLNRERLALLEAELMLAKDEERLPDVKTLLRAMFVPVLRLFQSGAGGVRFAKIFNRIHARPESAMHQHFIKFMMPILQAFFSALSEALPQIPKDILFARLFFCIGTMAHGAALMSDADLREMAPKLGMPKIPDPKTMENDMIDFLVRGMEAG